MDRMGTVGMVFHGLALFPFSYRGSADVVLFRQGPLTERRFPNFLTNCRSGSCLFVESDFHKQSVRTTSCCVVILKHKNHQVHSLTPLPWRNLTPLRRIFQASLHYINEVIIESRRACLQTSLGCRVEKNRGRETCHGKSWLWIWLDQCSRRMPIPSKRKRTPKPYQTV